MPIIQFIIGLQGAVGIALWSGNGSLAAKIIITALLFAEVIGFSYTQFEVAWNDAARKVGVLLCTMVNMGIILYGLYLVDVLLMIAAGVPFVLLIIWSIAASVFKKGR